MELAAAGEEAEVGSVASEGAKEVVVVDVEVGEDVEAVSLDRD